MAKQKKQTNFYGAGYNLKHDILDEVAYPYFVIPSLVFKLNEVYKALGVGVTGPKVCTLEGLARLGAFFTDELSARDRVALFCEVSESSQKVYKTVLELNRIDWVTRFTKKEKLLGNYLAGGAETRRALYFMLSHMVLEQGVKDISDRRNRTADEEKARLIDAFITDYLKQMREFDKAKAEIQIERVRLLKAEANQL